MNKAAPARTTKRLLMAGGLAAILGLIGAVWGMGNDHRSSAGAGATTAPRTVEIAVERIACRLCAARITDAVQSLAGVEDVRVRVADGVVQATYIPSQVTAERIAFVISDLGYPASLSVTASEVRREIAGHTTRSFAGPPEWIDRGRRLAEIMHIPGGPRPN